jgi:AcrR family transcriptional regulator
MTRKSLKKGADLHASLDAPEKGRSAGELRKPADSAPAGVRGAGRWADVYEAALTLFAKYGYNGTSMKDIAKVLRMRAPSLYNHVAAKQDLLRDIVVTTHEMADRELRAAIASSDDVAEQLRRATEVHVRYHAHHPREGRVASREIEHLDEPARTQVRTMRRNFESLVISIIERGVELGRFEVANAKLTAYAIFRMSAAVAQWYRPGREFSDSEIAFCYGDLALRMVHANHARPQTTP